MRGEVSISVAPAFSEPRPLPQTSPELAPLWSRIIRAEGVSPLLRAVLINSTLESLEGGRATIVSTARYAADAEKRWRGSIIELLTRESGASAPIELTIRSTDGAIVNTPPTPSTPSPIAAGGSPPGSHGEPSAAPTPAPSRPGALAASVNNAADHPLVKQALELFGGRIVDIQPRRRA